MKSIQTIGGEIKLGPVLEGQFREDPERTETLIEGLTVLAMSRFVEPQTLINTVEAVLAKGQDPFSVAE